METFDRWSVVVVPFPFTESPATKRRPALIVSEPLLTETAGPSILTMITSAGKARWPSDVVLSDLQSAGLRSPSLVRFKLFTLDQRLILRRSGQLGKADRDTVTQALAAVLGF